MRISDWSSDVLFRSGDGDGAGLGEPLRLRQVGREVEVGEEDLALAQAGDLGRLRLLHLHHHLRLGKDVGRGADDLGTGGVVVVIGAADALARSEEHTSELQSLMRISYAVFCLKKKK